MNAFILGNAGSGKTTLAAKLASASGAARFALDDVAFDGGTQRRPLDASVADVRNFMATHDRWIIEGCYADIIAAVIQSDHELLFLNPGTAICIARCRSRAWEPQKYPSPQDQHGRLEALVDWVRQYDTRADEYGLLAHRRLFDSFAGRKREILADEP